MVFSRQEYWSGLPFLLQGNLPNPGVQTEYPSLAGGFFTTEPSGNPKNTGMGSLSLLQRIFPTQESNPGSPALQEDSLPEICFPVDPGEIPLVSPSLIHPCIPRDFRVYVHEVNTLKHPLWKGPGAGNWTSEMDQPGLPST